MCEVPQIHLLSLSLEPRLHDGCPDNCRDLLSWLPQSVVFTILSYLDPGKLDIDIQCHIVKILLRTGLSSVNEFCYALEIVQLQVVSSIVYRRPYLLLYVSIVYRQLYLTHGSRTM